MQVNDFAPDTHPRAAFSLHSPTSRQIQCIALVGQGKTDWEIGRILGISPETVKRHIAEARRHFDVTKRVQLVVQAIAAGLLSLDELTCGRTAC